MNGHLATYSYLSRNGFHCQSSLTSAILSHIRLDGFAAGGEDFQSHVAAGFGPFIVLLGQHRADQADDGVAAGEDADHVGPAADLLVQPLLYPALAGGASEWVLLLVSVRAGQGGR